MTTELNCPFKAHLYQSFWLSQKAETFFKKCFLVTWWWNPNTRSVYLRVSVHFSSSSRAILSIFSFSSSLVEMSLASCCCFWVSISPWGTSQARNISFCERLSSRPIIVKSDTRRSGRVAGLFITTINQTRAKRWKSIFHFSTRCYSPHLTQTQTHIRRFNSLCMATERTQELWRALFNGVSLSYGASVGPKTQVDIRNSAGHIIHILKGWSHCRCLGTEWKISTERE